MRYLIIGLGIYGTNLARDLTTLGNQVIGADIKQSATTPLKDYISQVYIVDTTDEESLDVLPLKNVDLVIVAIGENFGASVKTVALLKKKNVPHIFARAIDELHRSILECFKIDRILTPEQRAASDQAYEMMFGGKVETMSVDPDTIILQFKAPGYFLGEEYSKLNLSEFAITLIAATRNQVSTSVLNIRSESPKLLDTSDANCTVSEGDTFTCIGSRAAFRSLLKRIS